MALVATVSEGQLVLPWAPGMSRECQRGAIMNAVCHVGGDRGEARTRPQVLLRPWMSEATRSYAMALKRVMFWDASDDGRIDFAARRRDGSWNLLTLVPG